MEKNIVDSLSRVDFLSDLHIQQLNEIAKLFHWEQHSPGDVIIQQGQLDHCFYVLAEGQVEALVAQDGQGQVRTNTFGPGDSFGKLSLCTGEPSPTTIRCLEASLVLAMKPDDFKLMLSRWPILYKKLAERFSRHVNLVNLGLWEAKHQEFLRSTLQQSQFESKFYSLWGGPKTTKAVESKLELLARQGSHLLLSGERGTGRQMFAWHLHRRIFGPDAPFVAMDGNQAEEQLGDWRNSSLLKVIEGGTLYLREINEIPLHLQRKLVQILPDKANNCLLIGTLRDQPESFSQQLLPEFLQLFRQQHTLVPLRDRKRDIPLLAQGILDKLSHKHQRPRPDIHPEALNLLLSHNYRQGNVAELIQMLERAFFLADQSVIRLDHVFFGPTAEETGGTFDLLSFPLLKNMIKAGKAVSGLQYLVGAMFSALLLIMLLWPQTAVKTGIFLFAWGIWWPLLALVSPLAGRIWCTICPFSLIIAWAQKLVHFNKPVPEWLKKHDHWLITFLFLLIFWLEAVFNMRTNPLYTSLLLLAIAGAAALFGVIFARHAWCRHLCPLGGFVGMASTGAMLEVRSDVHVCLNKCTTFDCYRGNEQVAGCPMSQHAPYLDNNLACKMCLQCVQACPNDAVRLNLRFPGREIWHLVRVNQGFVAFIGSTLAILFPLILLEPLRNQWPGESWLLWFSFSYWLSGLAGGLAAWHLAHPFRTKAASKNVKLVFAFIPLVLAGHIIYQLHFVPGINFLQLGLAWTASTGIQQSSSISLYHLGQALAVAFGLALTLFTVFKVRGKN